MGTEEKKFFYDHFEKNQIWEIGSFGHIFTIILFLILTVAVLYFLIKLDTRHSRKLLLITAISVSVMEIIKISLRIAKNQAYDSWVPLYYCSLFIFAIWLTVSKNPKIQRIGYIYIGMGAVIAAPFNIIYPSTSLALFPIWHPAEIHSFVYHFIMFITGLYILIKKIYVPKRKDSVIYLIFIFVACIVAVILNEALGTNCMFLADAFGLPILDTLASSCPIIYMLIVFFAQGALMFWMSFGIYKLIIYLKKRKKQYGN